MKSKFTSLLKPSLHPPELDFVLNQLPQAAFIWDTKRKQVISCNSKLIELTGMTRQDLYAASLPDIFPHMSDVSARDSTTESSTTIQTSTGPKPVRIQISRAGQPGEWILVKLVSEQDLLQKEAFQSIEAQRWEALHVLTLSPLHENLGFSIKQALQAGQLLTGASFLAVYLPKAEDDNQYRLAHSWGEVGEFPETISVSEISHLRIPYTWQPGTRATSILHQKALALKLTYLATSPIDQSSPLDGILLAGDQISRPPGELVQMLQVLTGVIDTCRKHFNEVDHALVDTKTLNEKLNICEVIKNVIADGMLLVDDDKNIVDINASAAETLGYSVEEVLGKSVGQILIGEVAIEDLLDQDRQQQTGMHDLGEVRLHRRDGAAILINLRLMPFSNQVLSPTTAILLSDLSKHEEFRQRSKQLEQQAVLGEVMAIFAHEVRNPINNIGMGLQVMSASYEEDDPMQAEISRMKQDIDRLEDLMKSVLSVSRSTEYKMKPVDVKPLLENILARWSPRMARYKIENKIIAAAEVPLVKGDKRALEQVFTNLIQNAINSMKSSGGSLSIRITRPEPDPHLTIDVIDTGLGIPPEIRDHIFEPFFTTNSEGTGLGLAISKRIIVAHSGNIEVLDSFPGGTVFRIQLPLA
jgi:two-component system sensor histidine kinase AtoS